MRSLANFLAAVVILIASGSAALACAKFHNRGGYWTIENACSRTIYVRWTDQGNCRSGCGARIGGYREQTINAPNGRYSWDVD
jgi:hypothetical protein